MAIGGSCAYVLGFTDWKHGFSFNFVLISNFKNTAGKTVIASPSIAVNHSSHALMYTKRELVKNKGSIYLQKCYSNQIIEKESNFGLLLTMIT